MFAPTYLGKWSNSTSRFFKGVGSTSNRHLVEVRWVLSCYKHNYICTCVAILSNWFSTNDWLVGGKKCRWFFCWEQFLVKQLKSFPEMPYAYCWVNTTNSNHQPLVGTAVIFPPWALDSPMTPEPSEGRRSEKRQQDLLLLWSSSSCGHGTMSFTTTVRGLWYIKRWS